MSLVKIVQNARGIAETLNSDGVHAEVTRRAEQALAAAQSSAPVVTGEYRDGLHIEDIEKDGVRAVAIAGSSSHDYEVEADTGNLARALDAAGGL